MREPAGLFHSICMSAAFRENLGLLQSLCVGHVGYFAPTLDAPGAEREPALPRFSSFSPFCSALRKDPYFNARCVECDRKHLRIALKKNGYHCYVCHAGCWESMIVLRGPNMTPMGVLSFGQIRACRSLPDPRRYARHADAAGLKRRYRQLPFMTGDTVEKWARVFDVASRFIADSALREVQRNGWVRDAFEYIEQALERPITLREIAEISGKSPSFVTHNFSKCFGAPFRRYVNDRRIARARDLLRSGHSIKEVASAVGFGDRYVFTKTFTKLAGVSPGAFRRGKEGTRQRAAPRPAGVARGWRIVC